MKDITLKAKGKINISLIIKGIMQDGYHELDTLMCPIELYDIVNIKKRSDKIIQCEGFDVPYDNNTAVKAARLLMDEFDTTGVDISIEKNIPYSAGLGGSSADAAAVMYAFSKLYYIDYNKIRFLGRQIGSDVPFLMQVNSGGMRARGRGDILTAEDIQPLSIVIAKPEQGVDTQTAYKVYDKMNIVPSESDNNALIEAIRNGDDLCPYLINDLYLPAKSINGGIEPLLNIMKQANSDCAIMSGSGSAVIAICKDAESASKVYEQIPDRYYKKITTTCNSAIEEK